MDTGTKFLIGGLAAVGAILLLSQRSHAALATPHSAPSTPITPNWRIVRDFALPASNTLSLRGVTKENWDSFPGNPLEIQLENSLTGERRLALANGQKPGENGAVIATVDYEPENTPHVRPTDPANGYRQASWMPNRGETVALFPTDVRLILANDGSVLE